MSASGRKKAAVPRRNTIDCSYCWKSLTGHERSSALVQMAAASEAIAFRRSFAATAHHQQRV
jgi:hypothetical protein